MQEITISTCLKHIAISCCCSAFIFSPIMQSVHIRGMMMKVFPFKEKNNGPYISSAKWALALVTMRLYALPLVERYDPLSSKHR